MTINKKGKQNTSTDISVKKDWLIAGVAIAGFVTLIKNIGWISQDLNFSQLFNLVDFYTLFVKMMFVSALVWSFKRVIFKNTLGKAFGEIFDSGWNEMSNIEKARWVLGIFIVLFITLLFNL